MARKQQVCFAAFSLENWINEQESMNYAGFCIVIARFVKFFFKEGNVAEGFSELNLILKTCMCGAQGVLELRFAVIM